MSAIRLSAKNRRRGGEFRGVRESKEQQRSVGTDENRRNSRESEGAVENWRIDGKSEN